jgi:ribosome-associated toxin RatA of RatAB toxin-antitoxin module
MYDATMSAALAQTFGFTADEWAKLASGAIISHVDPEPQPGGRPRTRALVGVTIGRPVDECFEEMARYEGLASYLPGLRESRIVERTAEGFTARETMRVMILRFRYGVRVEVDRAQREVRWTLDDSEPCDIEHTEGSWRFAALDADTTLARYFVIVDSGMWIPISIQNWINRRRLRAVAAAFRRHLESRAAM